MHQNENKLNARCFVFEIFRSTEFPEGNSEQVSAEISTLTPKPGPITA